MKSIPSLWQLSFLVFLCVIISCSGCYIRNCPPGGKRGLNDHVLGQRRCMSCAKGAGICVGPDICCGREIGCHMGTQLSSVCAKENESPTACSVPGRQCGPNNQGKCVASGICCTSDTCASDGMCQGGEDFKPQLVQLLQALLEKRSR
ncbi:terepressin/terephysin-like [Lineus longissimus]|uniref:terepressin/terephysin-like n=1 Tax=Lineus longissimus TaxID=88925 RepID=UPI00315C79E8